MQRRQTIHIGGINVGSGIQQSQHLFPVAGQTCCEEDTSGWELYATRCLVLRIVRFAIGVRFLPALQLLSPLGHGRVVAHLKRHSNGVCVWWERYVSLFLEPSEGFVLLTQTHTMCWVEGGVVYAGCCWRRYIPCCFYCSWPRRITHFGVSHKARMCAHSYAHARYTRWPKVWASVCVLRWETLLSLVAQSVRMRSEENLGKKSSWIRAKVEFSTEGIQKILCWIHKTRFVVVFLDPPEDY